MLGIFHKFEISAGTFRLTVFDCALKLMHCENIFPIGEKFLYYMSKGMRGLRKKK